VEAPHCRHVDLPSEQSLGLATEAYEGEPGLAGCVVDKEVDITVRAVVASGERADLLIALGPGRGFRDLMDFCEEVEAALRRRIDVVLEDGLSPYIRERVLKEAVAL